ncbi:hypothetical protein AL505_100154 [Escherichia coli]|nr:hypothetical protein AL505_100154 [Escherichia coli]
MTEIAISTSTRCLFNRLPVSSLRPTLSNHKQPNKISAQNSAAYTLFISKGRSYSMVMKTMFTNAKMLFL